MYLSACSSLHKATRELVTSSAAEVELDHLLLQPIYHQEISPLAPIG